MCERQQLQQSGKPPQPLQSTSEKTKEQHKHKTTENPHQKSWHNECHAVIEEDLKIALETMNL